MRLNKFLVMWFAFSAAVCFGAINSFDLLTANRADIDNVRVDGNTVSTTNTNGDLTFDLNGTGSLIFTDLTASKALSLDGSKKVISGTLPIAAGGTNSATALNNNRVMVSSSGAIAEASAITASRALVSDSNGIPTHATTTATEIGYVNGVTSAIQTQLNTKAPSASPTFTGTVTLPVTASRALVTGASSEVGVSTTTATEIGYVSGVTSAIQTQINTKAPSASPTFTGTFTGPWTTAGPLITSSGGVVTSEAALAIARGGTGQSTAQAAIDALVPSQGSNSGKFLKTDGTNVSWATPSGSALSVSTKTNSDSPVTVSSSDDIILCNAASGAITFNLPASASNTGKVWRFVKTDTSANACTIDGNSSETIGGSTTKNLKTQYESISIVADGTNIQVLDRKTKFYLGALTTVGTWTTGATYAGKYWRDGDMLTAQVYITASGAVTSAGLALTLPSSLTIDTTKAGASDSTARLEGGYRCSNPGDNAYDGVAAVNSSTAVSFWRPITKDGNAFSELYTGNMLTQAAPFTIGSGDTCSVWYQVPISGWED